MSVVETSFVTLVALCLICQSSGNPRVFCSLCEAIASQGLSWAQGPLSLTEGYVYFKLREFCEFDYPVQSDAGAAICNTIVDKGIHFVWLLLKRGGGVSSNVAADSQQICACIDMCTDKCTLS